MTLLYPALYIVHFSIRHSYFYIKIFFMDTICSKNKIWAVFHLIALSVTDYVPKFYDCQFCQLRLS